MNVLELAQVVGKPVKEIMQTLIDAGSDVENAMAPVGAKYFRLFNLNENIAAKKLVELKAKSKELSDERAAKVAEQAPSVEEIAGLPQCRILPDNFKCSKENPQCLETTNDGKNCLFAV